MAYIVPPQPTGTRLRAPTGPVPARGRQRVRAASTGLPFSVPQTRCIVRDAAERAGDGVRGEDRV